MSTAIVSDINFVDPDNVIPYLEADDAIIRSATLGLVDFSNTASFSVAGAIPAATPVKSLTVDATAGSIVTAFDAISGGLLPFSKGVNAATVNLPATFRLKPATTKRSLAIVWAKVPATGWAAGVASNFAYLLCGLLGNTGNQAQWGLSIIVNSSGAVTDLRAFSPSSGSGSTANLGIVAGAALTSVTDGNLHQIAFEWDAQSVAGFQTGRLYLDQALIAQTASVAWDGTFNAATSYQPALGWSAAFQPAGIAAGLKLGRPSLWDLTGLTTTIASILANDAAAANGYLS